MPLKKIYAAVPACLFVAIFAGFVLTQRYGIDIYRQYYLLCHLLWGFGGPLLFGYFHLDLRQIRKSALLEVGQILRTYPIWAWPWALVSKPRRNQYTGAIWSPWSGALWVLTISIWNEVFVDPVQNAIPFIQAYHHLVADVVGVGVFLIVCGALKSRRASGHSSI